MRHRQQETALNDKPVTEERIVEQVVIRLNAAMTGTVLGLMCGGLLFLATNWLVLKGGPNPGPHLSLLSQYFPGYSVTFVGSFVGLLYAFAVGFGAGYLLGAVYNRLAR
jgi:hypothetical protein